MMKSWMCILGSVALSLMGCGQETLTFPPSPPGPECGPGYPTLPSDGGDPYAFKEGAIAPCLLFESAALDGEPGYLHFADIHLQAKHGNTDATSLVIVVSAKNCPSCALLMNDISEMVDDFESAGAMMIAGVWCDNVDRDDCDFTLDKAVSVATAEGWPSDRWWVTNDAERALKPAFSETFPAAIVVRLADMRVVLVDRIPTAAGLFETVDTL